MCVAHECKRPVCREKEERQTKAAKEQKKLHDKLNRTEDEMGDLAAKLDDKVSLLALSHHLYHHVIHFLSVLHHHLKTQLAANDEVSFLALSHHPYQHSI